ncbi:hypothetical protein KEM55_004542, partial [Ascosphaera atra]
MTMTKAKVEKCHIEGGGPHESAHDTGLPRKVQLLCQENDRCWSSDVPLDDGWRQQIVKKTWKDEQDFRGTAAFRKAPESEWETAAIAQAGGEKPSDACYQCRKQDPA